MRNERQDETRGKDKSSFIIIVFNVRVVAPKNEHSSPRESTPTLSLFIENSFAEDSFDK